MSQKHSRRLRLAGGTAVPFGSGEEAMNPKLRNFLDECRVAGIGLAEDNFFTKLHRAGDDDPAYQALDDRIIEIVEQKNRSRSGLRN
jgi:hypothetical protein